MYRLLYTSLLIILATLPGCTRGPSQGGGGAELLVVPVAQPVQRKVADFVDYTGRTNAVVNDTIQARVTGFLLKNPPFKEGAYVRAGDILFEIDPRPYEAQLKAAEFQHTAAQSQVKAAKDQLEANKAKLKYDIATNARFKELAQKQKGAVSEKELDQYQANEDLSKANVATAEANIALAEANLAYAAANLELPRLNLGWTKVRSPIDGHISRYFLTKGNLVIQDSSQLTTVMSVDPMYVYFDMDEPTMLRSKQTMYDSKGQPYFEGMSPNFRYASMAGALALQELEPLPAATVFYPSRGAPVYIGLQGEEGFLDLDTGIPRHAGYINFTDNQVNAGTDSIQIRGVFDNPKLSDGKYQLVPGMFVRVRLPIGQEQDRLLVIDRAIISEQGQKKIFVVAEAKDAKGDFEKDKDGKPIFKVEERVVTLGPLLDNGLRVVSGKDVGPNDWVMYTFLQQVRPGMEVQPERRTMPEFGKPSAPVAEGKKGKS